MLHQVSRSDLFIKMNPDGRMNIETCLKESRAEALVDVLGFETVTGKDEFKKQLRFFTENPQRIKKRQEAILKLRHSGTTLDPLFKEVSELELQLTTFFKRSDVETNSYQQILFSGWKDTEVFNLVPFLLLITSFFKQYVVPLTALLMPLIILVAPYIAIRYWYNLPITTEQYIHVLLTTMGLPTNEGWTLKHVTQVLFGLLSLGQSIIQPIQNAVHISHIDKDMIKFGSAVERFSDLFSKICPELENPLVVASGDVRKSFALSWDTPFRLKIALKQVGDMEVVYRLARSSAEPVKFVNSQTPFLLIRGGFDPFLENPVPFDFRSSSSHTLLTGPNKGGKSSVLRSLLLSVTLAQTFGFAYAKKMVLKPFDWIATGLRLEDRPGSASMFESEVLFATQILQRANKKQVGLVLFDELFHSTNPPDGERTAEIFLRKLWLKPNVISFISTHVFSLVDTAPQQIKKLCVPAFKENNTLRFTYTLRPGICKESSVDLILQEKGLL